MLDSYQVRTKVMQMKSWIRLLPVLLTLSIYGCRPKAASIPGLTMREAVVDTVVMLTQPPSSPRCHLSVDIQYAEGTSARTVNDAILRSDILQPEYMGENVSIADMPHLVQVYAKDFLTAYVRENKALFLHDKNHARDYDRSYRLRTDTWCARDGILTYYATITAEEGENRQPVRHIARNINIRTGHILTLDDIFLHGYEHKTKEVLWRALTRMLDADSKEQLTKNGIAGSEELYLTDNFILGKDKITLIYSPGEIVSEEKGEIQVTIRKKDIGKLMRQ